MKRFFLSAFLFIAALAVPVAVGFAADGFDEWGYNETANLFNGTGDSVDRNLDGKYQGAYPQYANDKLLMKWTDEWNRGNDENWGNPPYADAWLTNEWNGRAGGSGETWHYKFLWVGTEMQNSPYWRDGGYPIWGQFEVIFSHGTAPNEHFWDAHAERSGFGAK